MSTFPKPKLTVLVLAIAALLALPAAANATLSYTKGFAKPHVYVAGNDGKGARSAGPGRNSHVSPNGEWVVFQRESANSSELRLYSVADGKSERLLNPLREEIVAWSPDSTKVAVVAGKISGPGTLTVIEVESGRRAKIATGYFNQVSFSPDGEDVVYGIAPTEDFLKSNIYRSSSSGTGRVVLSNDHASAFPLWGPGGQIVFVREFGTANPQNGPKNQLFLMNENGERISRLTNTKVGPLGGGLMPTAWSESGNQLLAEYGGEDMSYAVAIDPTTGAEKKLTSNPESGFAGTAISPDGSTVLGDAGIGFGGAPKPKVVTVPFKGGPQKVLVPGGYEPSWGGTDRAAGPVRVAP